MPDQELTERALQESFEPLWSADADTLRAGLAAGQSTPDEVLRISHDRPTEDPADDRAARSWLPAPDGDFRPILRMHEPAPAVLDQSYVVPAITGA